MKNYLLYFLFIISFLSQLQAFDNGGNPGDSNGDCPGENINLPLAGPSPFSGNGNVHGDNGDWSDRFKFTIPLGGSVTVTVNSTAHTDLDFKMSAEECNNQDLVRYTDDSTDVKTFTFNATANHTYYISIFDNQWRDQSNPYILTIEYPTNGGSSCEDYDSNNDDCPGRIITSMDQITSSKSTCITGISRNNDGSHKKDYYRFQVQTNGTLRIRGTSPNNHKYHLRVGSSCGGTQYYGDTRSKNHDTGDITLHTGDTIYIRAKETGNDDDQYRLNLSFTADDSGTPPIMNDVSDMTVNVGDSVSRDLSTYVTKTEGDDILEYQLSGSLPGGVSFNTSTGQLSGSSTSSGDYALSIKARDKDGWSNSQSWTLHIKEPVPQNIPPVMNDVPNQTLKIRHSIDFDIGNYVTKTDNDPILNYHLSGTLPDSLSFSTSSGKITGTADNSSQVDHDFWLTVWATDKDGDSNKKSFKIHIAPKGTDVTQGDLDFYIANSLESRNIRGNYLILGNTVECHTKEKNKALFSQNQHCEDMYYGNNGHISNYIDIDNDTNTWNSTSSNFTIPANSKILWAGLFWQGMLNNMAERHSGDWWQIQRHAEPNSSDNIHAGWSWVENTGDYFSIESTAVNKVLLKVDNESSYEQITADTLAANNVYFSGNHIGGPYAAFADITQLMQNRNITSGKHTITVANIIVTQGMDGNWIGDYGGWSIAIVYQNKNESIKNISVFNGFTTVSNSHGDKPPKYITISGFKLPKHNNVDSYLSVFSGEGEYNNHGDTMKLEGNLMPGITEENQYNVFDEISHGLDRDSTPWYNDLTYADTIDVDRYDVSQIMTNLRDENPDIHQVTIEVATHQGPSGEFDAFFPSMFAFSAQLYVPKVCYDYDLKVGEYYDISSTDRVFQASALGDEPLRTKIMLKSEEADFDLIDAKMRLKFTPDTVFSYIPNSSQTTYPNTYSYHNAIDTDANTGEIAVGSNPTGDGGTIAPYNFIYSKLYYKFNKPQFNGKFDIYVDAKVSFDGVHKIPYTLSTNEPADSIFNISRCSTNPTYDAVYGMFNIERGDSKFSQSEEERYSLYTQVVGVPYEVSVAAYKKDSNGEYKSPLDTHATVELELIDASSFENNSSSGYDSICRDPDSYNMGKLVKFNNNSRVKVKIPDDFPVFNGKTTYPDALALKNAAFRVWLLVKKVGDKNIIVEHNCNTQSDSSCFDKVYKDNYASSSNKCSSECTNSSGTTCYNCLRKNFSLPICSRDNFAIRPESYHIAISDNNETHSDTKVSISENNSSATANLAAGYLYHLDINATKFSSQQEKALGYYFSVVGDKNTKKAITQFNDSVNCNDTVNHDLNIYMLNGQSEGFESLDDNNNTPENGLILNNSGRYQLHLEDLEWTKVDHKGYKYKPFKNHSDCNPDSTNLYNGSLNAKRGCDIKSNLTGSYYDLNVNMHPYRFDLNTINSYSNPNGTSNYIYINDLTTTQNLIQNDTVMAIKVAGQIIALGKDGKELSNYSSSCSAQNLNLSLGFNKIPTDINDSLGNNLTLNYALYDSNAGDNSVAVKSKKSDGTLNINFNNRYFYNPSEGNFNSYFNFKREYNNPINPFKLHFNTISAQSINDQITVDMQKNFIPSGAKELNITKTLYYAKIKSESDFYDDIYDDNVTTPLYVSIFCNQTLNYCANYGIDTNNALTDEYNWWLSLNHNGNLEGEAILKTNPNNKASLTPAHIKNFINGVANNVTVISLDRLRSDLPYTVFIEPDASMISRYPWLLYNQYSNTPPKYIYKVRFVDSPANWSGKGKTGHTINVNSTGRKSKKVDW